MSDAEPTSEIKRFLSSENTIKGLFIASIASISALVSFSYALGSARKSDSNVYDNKVAQLHTDGSQLALRALKWGTFYAVTGCGLIIFGSWKLANSKKMAEIREKFGSVFPPVPKNFPPQGRTEFESISDFMQYLDDEFSTKKVKESDESTAADTSLKK